MDGFIFLIIWLVATSFSILTNRDIFSPAKFYFLCLFVFFGDIFFSSYKTGIYVIYVSLIIVGVMIAILEKILTKRYYCRNEQIRYSMSGRRLNRITIELWILSLVPIISQFYLIDFFGGIEGYVNILRLRVLEFRGLGPVIVIANTIVIINIFYFGVGIILNWKSSRWWTFYLIHLTCAIVFSIWSGSRGVLLNHFLMMAIMYHYLKRPLSIKVTGLLAISLLFAAIVIGEARQGYKMTGGGFETGLKNPEQLLDLDHYTEIKAGLIPLELVLSQAPENLQYGLTFLSGLTNIIPRMLWSGKPDTGGVVFTKNYFGEVVSITTNYSGGIITESIINFGKVGGILFGFISLFSLLVLIVSVYSKIISRMNKSQSIKVMVQLISYIFIMRGITALPILEFANGFVSIITSIVPLWLIYIIVFRLKIVTRSGKG